MATQREGVCRWVYRAADGPRLRCIVAADGGELFGTIRRIGDEHLAPAATAWLPAELVAVLPAAGLVIVAGGAVLVFIVPGVVLVGMTAKLRRRTAEIDDLGLVIATITLGCSLTDQRIDQRTRAMIGRDLQDPSHSRSEVPTAMLIILPSV